VIALWISLYAVGAVLVGWWSYVRARKWERHEFPSLDYYDWFVLIPVIYTAVTWPISVWVMLVFTHIKKYS
jgi:hypothetical protein